jgi:hypothetical protein
MELNINFTDILQSATAEDSVCHKFNLLVWALFLL